MQAGTSGPEARLHIRPLIPILDYENGESIAINGVCLTVETFADGAFWAYASGETLARSNLGQLVKGSEVNLERALRLGDRLGGHLVSGHVDALCTVDSVRKSGSSRIYRFDCPPEQARYIIGKGSVAVDGVSLTVNDCGPDFFEVNVIPATQEATTMGQWRSGRKINLETDLIGKYVERMLAPWAQGSKPDASKPGLDLDFFRGNGF